MFQAYEFLFCPVHGVLRPANWPLVGLLLPLVRGRITGLYYRLRKLSVI